MQRLQTQNTENGEMQSAVSERNPEGDHAQPEGVQRVREEVTRSSKDCNPNVPYTHVMLGVTVIENPDGKIEYYAVSSMVQERVNQNSILVESNILSKLYPVNAKK